MSSDVSTASLQMNLQFIQSAANSTSKVNSSQTNTEQAMVYAKEGDARYEKEMDSNEDGSITYEEYIKYCEEHAASTYTENPGFTAVLKTEDPETKIQSVRPLNIGKALSAYSNSEINLPEAQIKSEA